LRWEWEVRVPELGTAIFVLPAEFTKNREERAVVLNKVARSVVEAARGTHREFVFVYNGAQLKGIENNAWRRAWKKAGLPVDPLITRGVHNLRHTFGHRLKAAGVSAEDRRVLLGHGKANVTENYSLPDLRRLAECVERIEERTETVILRPVRLAKS
jgi:integrase